MSDNTDGYSRFTKFEAAGAFNLLLWQFNTWKTEVNIVKYAFENIYRNAPNEYNPEGRYWALQLNVPMTEKRSCLRPNKAVKVLGISAYNELGEESETIQYLNTVKKFIKDVGDDRSWLKLEQFKKTPEDLKNKFNLETMKKEINNAVDVIVKKDENKNKCYKREDVKQHVKRIYDGIIAEARNRSDAEEDWPGGEKYSFIAEASVPAAEESADVPAEESDDVPAEGSVAEQSGGRRRRRRTASKRRSGKRRSTRKRSSKRRGGKKSVSKAGKRKTMKRKQ